MRFINKMSEKLHFFFFKVWMCKQNKANFVVRMMHCIALHCIKWTLYGSEVAADGLLDHSIFAMNSYVRVINITPATTWFSLQNWTFSISHTHTRRQSHTFRLGRYCTFTLDWCNNLRWVDVDALLVCSLAALLWAWLWTAIVSKTVMAQSQVEVRAIFDFFFFKTIFSIQNKWYN